MANTRIAPSPTGPMHIGTARTAYFNWLFARANGGKFIIRIDNTDASRSDDTWTDCILDTMAWLGLDNDGVYHQSDRADSYAHTATKLLDAGLARRADNGAVLLNDIDLPATWTDRVGGDMKINDHDRKSIDGLVLVRGDGVATYHFASVVDDFNLGIDTVIRGTDHISNTPKQIAIYTALGWTLPAYYHVGLIHKDKKKMSKRDSNTSMLFYRDAGYDPDAILNFLLRMGWGPRVDDKSTAVLPRDRALALFMDGRMRAAKANFDQAKLDSFNRKYIGRKENCA